MRPSRLWFFFSLMAGVLAGIFLSSGLQRAISPAPAPAVPATRAAAAAPDPARIVEDSPSGGTPTARIVEDSPSGGLPGKRWVGYPVTHVSAYDVVSPDDSAFGTWYWEFRTSGTSRVQYRFVANALRSNTSSLIIQASTNGIQAYKNTGGGFVLVLDTGVGYLATATDYRMLISRTPLGVTTLWVRGGIYTSWTQVSAAGGGSNPFTEVTITTCQYEALCGIDLSASTRFGDVRHYLGDMTPTEAVALGLVEP